MNQELWNKNQLVDYLKRNGLWAKKGLSQNFLVDRKALDTIVEAANLKPPLTPPLKGGEVNGDLVVEIGPGVGTLTQELVQRAGEVIAIELDEKLSKLLNCHIDKLSTTPKPLLGKDGIGIKNNIAMKQYNNLKVINADILTVNLDQLLGNKPYKVVANIPYAITSKILELFLSREHKPELMVLLVQKEVAERVAAKPGEMSVLSVSVQLYGKPDIVGIVPAESFFPSPKVDSAILKVVIARDEGSKQSIDRHATLAMTKEEEKDFFRLVHIGFASRRKTLVNNLSAGYRIPKEKAFDIIKKAGFKETVRAQELPVEDWKRLFLELPNIQSPTSI